MGAGDKILRTVRDKHHTLVLRVKTVSLTVGRSLVGTYFSNILSKSGWDDRDSSIRRPKYLREPQRGDVEINTFYQLSFCSSAVALYSTANHNKRFFFRGAQTREAELYSVGHANKGCLCGTAAARPDLLGLLFV